MTLLKSQLSHLSGKEIEVLQLQSKNKELSGKITDLETLHEAQTALLASEKQQEVSKLLDKIQYMTSSQKDSQEKER